MGTPPLRVQKRPEMVLPMPEVALPGQAFSWSGRGSVQYEGRRDCRDTDMRMLVSGFPLL
jgi:hypothetical protein